LGPLGFFFVNYQGTRQRSGLSPGTLISTSLPILPNDRSADNLAAIFSTPDLPPDGSGNGCAAPNPITMDDVTLALLNLKSNQFGGDGGGPRRVQFAVDLCYMLPAIFYLRS